MVFVLVLCLRYAICMAEYLLPIWGLSCAPAAPCRGPAKFFGRFFFRHPKIPILRVLVGVLSSHVLEGHELWFAMMGYICT